MNSQHLPLSPSTLKETRKREKRQKAKALELYKVALRTGETEKIRMTLQARSSEASLFGLLFEAWETKEEGEVVLLYLLHFLENPPNVV